MLRDKVFIKSAAHPFSKNFPFGQTNGVCRVCKKTFCCVKCRDRHMDTIHPNVNIDCALCVSEILPIRQYESVKLNLEDEKLLCHIVDKHLPLCCRLCGDLFKSKEDFKCIGTCKWYERWHCLTSPIGYENLEKKLKSCSISGSYSSSSSKFCTPPEIYRKTSTPMFVGQKAGFETLCVPEFSFKTPKANSSSIAQIASISKTQNDTQFFSFLLTSSEDLTPFKTSKNKQVPRYNSSRKLSITEEEEKIGNEEAEKITAGVIKMSFVDMVDMELTPPNGGILQNSSESDDVCEDAEGIVKKVRFSLSEYNTAEFENLMDSCARISLNMSEKFHEAHDETNEAKTTAEDIKSAGNTVDTDNMKDTCIVEDARCTNNGQAEGRRRSSIQPSTPLNDSEIRIIYEKKKNGKSIRKENQDPRVSSEGASTGNQRDSKRVLMMVLMESNSGGLTNDLMPLISSGLKKLQEQLISANYQSPSSAAETAKVHRKSITTMKMSTSSVETYSTDSAAIMTNHGSQIASSSSSSSAQSGETGNRFLSAIAQAMKHAMRSLAVSGLKIPPRSIEESKVTQETEIVEELISSQDSSSSGASNRQARSGKRAREVTEGCSKEDSTANALDAGSPLVKRQRSWYKMVKGRQPISRMRNSRVTTSPRGVSAETQVFSQGSLTVGDTVLPLPARAHQSTE